MLKLYISADLEGVCGVVSPHQCAPVPDRALYEAAVRQLAAEVYAVAAPALASGQVDEVLVNDAHCAMTNLQPELLGPLQKDPRFKLLSGKPKRCAMAAGLDNRFSGAIFVGYHAKAGTHQGVLCHTFHHKLFDVSVNGVSYGEAGINALYASLEFGVPLILTSGDTAYLSEIRALLPTVATVETKTGQGFSAATHRATQAVLTDYQTATQQLLQNPATWTKNLLSLTPPYVLEVTFINTLNADATDMMPGWERLDGRTLRYATDRFETIYRALQTAYALTNYVTYSE